MKILGKAGILTLVPSAYLVTLKDMFMPFYMMIVQRIWKEYINFFASMVLLFLKTFLTSKNVPLRVQKYGINLRKRILVLIDMYLKHLN
ncbi:unnamed protein product [Bathycoccus prasinos]